MDISLSTRIAIPFALTREARLVIAAQQGERQAFDALLRTYEGPLRGYLMRRVGKEAVEDVLAETWLASWVGLPHYNRRSRFKAWLFGIGFHKSVDHLRAHIRASREFSLEASGLDFPDTVDRIGATEQAQAVRAALAQLPPEQREVLELYYYAQLTLAEVAEALTRNLSTVKSQFYRAHTNVTQFLNAEPVSASATHAIALPDTKKSHKTGV